MLPRALAKLVSSGDDRSEGRRNNTDLCYNAGDRDMGVWGSVSSLPWIHYVGFRQDVKLICAQGFFLSFESGCS